MAIKVIILSLVWSWATRLVHAGVMTEVYKWKQIDYYNRGSFHIRPENIWQYRNVEYDPTSYEAYNNVPMGASHYNGRLFVTVPRRRPGIPSTLNYIDIEAEGSTISPMLRAYPSLEQNMISSSAENIVSVYRTTVDVACQRLWFIDTGMLEYPNNHQQKKRPSIWVVDLNTDNLIHRFEIPESIVDTGRGLASLAVDVVSSEQCGQAFAYIPDLVKSRLYVYSLAKDRMWAFDHNYFHFDPLAGDFSIGGQRFRWDDGIFSITLGKRQRDGVRVAYFNAMASNYEFAVSNQVLQNEQNAARSDHQSDFRYIGRRGDNKQSTMHQFDLNTGVLFFAEIQTNGVGCWNTNYPFSPANLGVVAADSDRMIYPSDLEIDEQGYIWVMTNSMPIFIYSKLNPEVYNFRVWKVHVNDAKRNTVCQ